MRAMVKAATRAIEARGLCLLMAASGKASQQQIRVPAAAEATRLLKCEAFTGQGGYSSVPQLSLRGVGSTPAIHTLKGC